MATPHNEIRTYRFVESTGLPGGFFMKKLEDIYRGDMLESERPHRHDYYAILYIEKGSGIHYIDFNEYPVSDQTVFFLLPGQMHQLLFFTEPEGRVLLFTDDFLIRHAIPQRLIDDLYLFSEYGVSPPMSIGEHQLEAYRNLIGQMQFFSESIDKYNAEALASLLNLFLILGNNHCSLKKEALPVSGENGNSLLRGFRKLLNKDYAAEHQVAAYADRLSVSADHLNKVIKGLTGVSAKDHIQNKLVVEAKRSLIFSDISNKELAFSLGFEESAHFNNFFRKVTGMTPGAFRTSARS